VTRTVRGAGRTDSLPRRQPGPAPQRLLATARRHWLIAVLLLAGLLLRVAALIAYRPILFYIDSTKYLYHGAANDPVGYRVPLRLILLVGNLDAVAATAHLLGLAMGVAIYAVLARRGVPRWLAALAAAPVLLDGYQLQIEQTMMPDVWFEALIVTGLVLLLWSPRMPLWAIALGGIALGLAATVAQKGQILVLPAVIYVLVAVGGWRRVLGGAALMCAAFALPILTYMSISSAVTGHFWLSHSGTTTLYGRAASAADCATLRLPAAQRPLCPAPSQKALGADGLEHSPHSPLRPYYAHLPGSQASATVSAFNRAVFTQQPGRVVASVAADAAKLFALTRNTRPGDTPIWRWQFQTSYPYWRHASPAEVRSVIRGFGGGDPHVVEPLADALRSYQLHGGFTPGPVYALATAAGLIGSLSLIGWPRRARRRTPAGRSSAGPEPARPVSAGPGQADEDPGPGRQVALACLLFFLTGAAVLVLSDVFEFSWRYQLPALVTLPAAGALGITAIRLRVSPRGPRPPAGPACP
jgi:hypothetical protein